MELIITNRKQETIIVLYDEIDHELISKYRWHNHHGYAATAICSSHNNSRQKIIFMHRLILGLSNTDLVVDHINHIRHDNRRSNIRPCTPAQNTMNAKPSGASKYLGVSIRYNRKKYGKIIYGPYYVAAIRKHNRSINLGVFKTEECAAKAYDDAARVLHGEFANLNFK